MTAEPSPAPDPLTAFAPGQIWTCHYGVRYAGCAFDACMTVLALADGKLALHLPGPINAVTETAIAELGSVTCLIAPGTYHWLHIAAAQTA